MSVSRVTSAPHRLEGKKKEIKGKLKWSSLHFKYSYGSRVLLNIFLSSCMFMYATMRQEAEPYPCHGWGTLGKSVTL